jgi:hypothetical protein
MSAYLNGSVAPSKHEDFASSQRVHRAGAEDDGKKEGRMEMSPWQVGIRSTGKQACSSQDLVTAEVSQGTTFNWASCSVDWPFRCTKRGPPPMGMQRCIARTCRMHSNAQTQNLPRPLRQPRRSLQQSHFAESQAHSHPPTNRAPQIGVSVKTMRRNALGWPRCGREYPLDNWYIRITHPDHWAPRNDGEQPNILSLRCPTRLLNLFLPSRESSGMLFSFSFICAVQIV